MASAARADNAAVSDVAFSVIVPTRGRKTVLAALESITEQFEPGDEVIVRCSRDEDFGNSARQSMRVNRVPARGAGESAALCGSEAPRAASSRA